MPEEKKFGLEEVIKHYSDIYIKGCNDEKCELCKHFHEIMDKYELGYLSKNWDYVMDVKKKWQDIYMIKK